jgi:hypothetical protein
VTDQFAIWRGSSVALFFRKEEVDIDSLVTREIEHDKVILPLWHKVSKDEPLTAAILLTTSGWTACLSMKHKVQD